MNLREEYFAALRASQRAERTRSKVLVSKSADGPKIAAVRDGSGRIIGFGAIEPVSPAEVARVEALPRFDVSKSAQVPTSDSDPNAVFDSLFSWCDDRPSQVEVAKSVGSNPENAVLEGLFPRCFQTT